MMSCNCAKSAWNVPENAGYEDWQFVVVAIFAIPLGVAIGLVIVFKVLFKDRE